ncbi:MAG TPA: hypothetical protein VMJ10_12135 [Kofleriaceae bacterium]|nr:hypothetical protein [Kofleriaceae bacterium]
MKHLVSILLLSTAACTGSATIAAGPVAPAPAPAPVVAAPPPAPAPAPVVVAAPPQGHPAYLHALTDLRHARAHLERPAGAMVKWDENRAIREIDAAINEIKRASIDDGKPLNDHPPVDAGMVWGNRLQKARELAEAARRDVNQEEDNAFAGGLRNRAIGHIDNAVRAIDEGIADAGARPAPPVVVAEPPPAPAAHPAYLHALSDMRTARALLERPARPEVKFDENNSIREIDAAINEIKQASIDDGKPLAEHPPIDAKWGHRDRLKEAQRLLHKAAQDIEEKEDNAWAKGLRARAIGHIRNAEFGIRDAMEDRRHGR